MLKELNIEIIKKSIKEIYNKTLKDIDITELNEKNKKEFTETLYFNIINSCLNYQYRLLKDNLYDRSIKNQKISSEIKGLELFNHYYKHQFTHCYTAFIDEYFEIDEAMIILSKQVKKDVFKEQSDVIEEVIDLFHFILQFGVLITELNCVKKVLKCNDINIDFNSNNLSKFLKSDVLVKYVETSLNLLSSNISSIYNSKNANISGDILYKTRNMIKKINWKDWKTYKEDHYSDDNIQLIKNDILNIFNCFIKYTFNYYIEDIEAYCLDKDIKDPICFWNKIFDNNVIKLSEIDRLLLIYGIYIAKNYVNIERQKNGY